VERLIQFIMANIGLAIVYFTAGFFTLTLSLPPSGANPLWAPAGIALAAVLIWGYRLLPGVFLGDFVVGYYMMGLSDTQALNLCLLFGVQAALQAGIGRYLLLRFQVLPSSLMSGWGIFKFFTLAALISTFVPALIVVLVEQYLGVLGHGSWLESLVLWWLGSALGIVVLTPVALILFADPQRLLQNRIVSFVIPMLLLFMVLVFVLHGARQSELERVSHRFDDNVKLAHALVERRLEMHQSLLENMGAIFKNSDEVTMEEFEAYANGFAEGKPEVLYPLGWIERVLDKDRADDESRHGYKITEFDITDTVFFSASQRNSYYVSRYLQDSQEMSEPLALSLQTEGVDICENKHRRYACQQMSETGGSYLVPQVDNHSKPLSKQLFLHMLPVFNTENEMLGMVYQLFKHRTLIEEFLTSDARQWVEVTITDANSGDILFSTLLKDERLEIYGEKPLLIQRLVNVADHQWLFNYSPSQDFVDVHFSWMLYWIMTGAFFIFSLIVMWLMTLTGRAQQIKKEVKEKACEVADKVKLLEESEAKYRCLVENIQDEYFIYSYNSNGFYSYISPSVTSILGYEQSDFLGHYATYFIKSEVNQHASKMIKQTLLGKSSQYEVELMAKSGEVHTFSIHENPVYDENGQMVLGAKGIAKDITSSKKTRLALEKLSLAVKHSPNVVVITDREGNIEYVNPKFTTVTGYSASEAIGKWPDIIISENTDPDLYRDLWETLLSGIEWRGELQHCKKNGDLYWAQEVISPMLDGPGHVTHFVVTQDDISQARQVNEQTSYLASHDLLTGLMNRHEFDARLMRAIGSSKRDLSQHALCYLDLDQFKVVNDTCGHVAGDELLRQIGTLMSANVRSRDTLARLGGDEFGLLMEHCGIEQAYQACESLIDLFQNFRFHWEEQAFTISVSIGLAIIDQHIEDNTEAMNNADLACYEAKASGRNQVKVHTEDDARLQLRLGDIQWSSEISDALDNNRLLLYAQPIVALSEITSYVGYEVLLRLKMKDGRIVPPGAFLPAAERYNSAARIDRWVVNHTLHWMNKHVHELGHVESISINLSGQSLDDEAMTEYIIREFERGDIPATKIKFEITETAAIANLSEATKFINTLKAYGCTFALDDFGSGLSSFAYLKNLDVDTLKIDGMFIKDMLDDRLDYEMVKSINEIGHVMGLKTVAEFVESKAILEKLKEIGVDYAQGYSLGKPVIIDEILKKQPEQDS
jgi:diguanylate cyclase (GGDEF)-like protein/PAS domain S-box-containing protein